MVYERPDIATFTAAFAAFGGVTQEQFDFWIDRAEKDTGAVVDCLGDNAVYVTMLVTAHHLERAGLGSGAAAQAFANGMDGFDTIKSGQLSLQRSDRSKAGSAPGLWGSTRYGEEAWPYIRACVAGPRVAGTGCVPSYGWPL